MDAKAYHLVEQLLDGRRVVIRAIRPGDKQALLDGFARLSEESIYRRFFTAKRGLTTSELTYLTELDFVSHVALLAVVREKGIDLPVGVGRFIVLRPATAAEVALTVDDEHQGLGVGTLLLSHLSRIAGTLGVEEFRAEVLAENAKMMDVFRNSGFAMRSRTSAGVVSAHLVLGEAV